MRVQVALLAAFACALLAAAPERGDPAPRLSGARSASEYWDVVARFESGHHLMARFLITNQGPGDRSAAAIGHLILPDGSAVKFHNGRRKGHWNLEAGGLTLDIGSSELELGGAQRALSYDSSKRGLKIHLRFQTGRALWSPRGERPDYRIDLLDLDVPVSGTLWREGMAEPLAVRGRGALSHTWMDERESALVLRRIDFASLGHDASVYVRELLHPSGERTPWLVVSRGGEVVLETSQFELDLSGRAAGAGAKGYPVPAVARIRGPGIDGSIRLGPALVEDDPLGDLPQLFRFLVSFSTRPWRVWTDSPFQLKLAASPERPALQLQGNGVTSVTFLNPLAVPASPETNPTPGA